MISRRSRINVKPNVKRPAAPTVVPTGQHRPSTPATPVPTSSTHATFLHASQKSPRSRPQTADHVAAESRLPETAEQLDDLVTVLIDEDDSAIDVESLTNLEPSRTEIYRSQHPVLTSALKAPSRCGSPRKVFVAPKSVNFADSPAPNSWISNPHTPAFLSRPSSVSTPSSAVQQGKGKQRQLTGHEKLDPKTFTMFDMITWNPKLEQGLLTPGHEGKRNNRGRKRTKNLVGDTATGKAAASPSKKKDVPKSSFGSPPFAPQVKIGADGSMLLDEESLTIRQENPIESNNWETVEEGRAPRKITSMSFRSRVWRKGTAWAEQETDLFFRILSATGPDFSLMHDFFPTRTRAELKNKFNREQRINSKRLNDALKMPSTLDESLYDIAKATTDLLDEKKRQDKLGRVKVKKTAVSEVADVSWDEQNADLEAEAREEIVKLETLIEQPSRFGRKRKMRQTPDAENSTNMGLVNKVLESVQQSVREKNEQKRLSDLQAVREADSKRFQQYQPLGLPLGSDFPPFEIVPTSAPFVSITAGQPPIVHLPRNSELKVIPPKDGSTARVLFTCPPIHVGGPAQEYVLQHERASDPNASDFLHLFGNIAPPLPPSPAFKQPFDQNAAGDRAEKGGGASVVDQESPNVHRSSDV